ncbi:MAG: DUF547 domain-containing protein [Bacteroidia bacterium]|nr:DUF547 domain-containing protein [Bacteroidia bacterium]
MKFLKIFFVLTIVLSISGIGHAKDLPTGDKVAENVSTPPSHQVWDGLLKKYVSTSGKVNYKGLKAEVGKLNTYLELLKSQAPGSSWSAKETKAYWINAYNAFTVKLILDNFPISSITKLDKPWDTAFINIGGKAYTLNDIEHKILRPTYKDARIHFAVNCASGSCPKLLNEAYTAGKLESQLNKQTRSYLNNGKDNKVAANSLQLSKIFKWYKDDFNSAGGVAAFVNKYTSVDVAKDAVISYLDYDWSLND